MYELMSAHTQAVLGGKGSGKSTFLILSGIELLEDKNKSILFDVGGIITQDKLKQIKVKDKINLMSISKSGLNNIKEHKEALKKSLQLIVDNRGILTIVRMELTAQESKEFFNIIIPFLMEIKNLNILIDEAQEVLPQNTKNSYSEELERMIRIGRNMNIKIFLATQRPQYLNKRALALCDIYYFGRIEYYLDARVCSEIIGIDGTKSRRNFRYSLKKLKVGNFYEIERDNATLIKYNLETQKLNNVFGRPTEWQKEMKDKGEEE